MFTEMGTIEKVEDCDEFIGMTYKIKAGVFTYQLHSKHNYRPIEGDEIAVKNNNGHVSAVRINGAVLFDIKPKEKAHGVRKSRTATRNETKRLWRNPLLQGT